MQVARCRGRRLAVTSDTQLASRIAGEAGELLLSIRSSVGRLAIDPRELGRYADERSNALILDQLAAQRPGDAVLSEEATDDPVRLSADRVWIVDPLDGTRGYMVGRDDWAVHVALWESGSGITAAAVALPAIEQVYASDTVGPAPWQPGAQRRRPIILVSPSGPPSFASAVAREVHADLGAMGSAGAKAMAVLCNKADAYLHVTGQGEWDSAAPVGVLRAAGFHASRIDGSDLIYNQRHPYIADSLLCRPEWAPTLLAGIARVRAAQP